MARTVLRITTQSSVSLVALGLWLIDNANLEQLAAACQQRQRYTFMLCLGPLRLRRVTGSPLIRLPCSKADHTELDDGGWVQGFRCEPWGLAGAEEISRFGGWRAWLAQC
jgi:hypothetical protein